MKHGKPPSFQLETRSSIGSHPAVLLPPRGAVRQARSIERQGLMPTDGEDRYSIHGLDGSSQTETQIFVRLYIDVW